MNVLVLAPHPDDESLGCGGTIALHANLGDRVTVVFLTSGELGVPAMDSLRAAKLREAEALEATAVLGVADVQFLHGPDGTLRQESAAMSAAIAALIDQMVPDRVLTPHPDDAHDDHAAATEILGLALSSSACRPLVLGYEIWSPLPTFEHVEDITGVIDRKLRAVGCHVSQVDQLPFDRGVRGLNAYRGAMSWGCEYAEVFRYLDRADLT